MYILFIFSPRQIEDLSWAIPFKVAIGSLAELNF